ncbi:MAG TPA: hypothetical protein VE662_00140, partial [Solirubrobacterales bacterium]|nr:hypothetical protein [Solirubrobacterales bacterium]
AGDRPPGEPPRPSVDLPVEVAEGGERDTDRVRPGAVDGARGEHERLQRAAQLVQGPVEAAAPASLPDTIARDDDGDREAERPPSDRELDEDAQRGSPTRRLSDRRADSRPPKR